MKFEEKLTITLYPINRGVYDAKTYGEEYLASLIHEAIGFRDRHAKPLAIEVVLDEHVAPTFGSVIFEYSARIERDSLFGGTQEHDLEMDLDLVSADEVVAALMRLRAATIGQLLLLALQYPQIRSNHDTMLELVDVLPSQI